MREMKDSGVAWIGEIPETWKVTINKTILKNISERNHPDAEVLSLYRDLGVVPKNSRDDNHNVTSENTAQYKFVEKGSLVINKMKAWQGSLAVSNYEGIVSPAYYVCEFRNNHISKDYVHYLLRSNIYAQQFERLSTGMRVGQWDLSIDDFLATQLLVPPEKEQFAIAECLDKKSLQIDALIVNVQAQIEKLKTYKQSLITEVVTKGLDPNAPMKDSGIEWIGKIPDSWNVSRIKYISDFGPTCDASKLTNDSIITYTPMECIKNGYFEPRSANYGALSHSLTAFQDGDIVLAKVTPCFENGNIAIMSDLDSNYGLGSSELFVLRPRTIHTRYFFYWLQNRYFLERGRATMTGTGGLKRVSPTFVKGCYIHIPPRPEQEKIADVLDTKCAQINRFISLKESKIEKLQQYKRSLIYEYVTGKKEVV